MFYIIIAKSKINKECSKYTVVPENGWIEWQHISNPMYLIVLPLAYKLV